jgi:hypothetical protein
MGLIFEKVDGVIMWLGEESQESDLAMELLTQWGERWRNFWGISASLQAATDTGHREKV